MQLHYIETCLSCYHRYNHENTVQIAIDKQTTYRDLANGLADWTNWGSLADELEITQEMIDELFWPVRDKMDEIIEQAKWLDEPEEYDFDSVYSFFCVTGE